MVIFISIKMEVDMWTLELGLVDKLVEVAPVDRPGHLRVCGRKKFPEGLPYCTTSLYSPDETSICFCVKR
jgi:hypothetical protein